MFFSYNSGVEFAAYSIEMNMSIHFEAKNDNYNFNAVEYFPNENPKEFCHFF